MNFLLYLLLLNQGISLNHWLFLHLCNFVSHNLFQIILQLFLLFIEIVKPTSMHLGRGMKSTENFATVAGKCCNWQPLITIFKFTFSGRGSLMVMICLQNVKQAKFLIAWYALFDCNSTAFFLLALAISWNFFFIFQSQFSSLLPFIVIHSRHPSYLNERRKRTDSFDNFEL